MTLRLRLRWQELGRTEMHEIRHWPSLLRLPIAGEHVFFDNSPLFEVDQVDWVVIDSDVERHLVDVCLTVKEVSPSWSGRGSAR